MSRIFSGVQPTNNLHIGNYLGAIKNWTFLQKENTNIFCVVDLHALTVQNDPIKLHQNILDTVKTYLALGIDPKKSIIFLQSTVKEHAELAWILNTIAKIPELERMTQFKDKAIQHKTNINLGLFSYPVLMAADILLYDTEIVPVGEDQAQHVELARILARRFNSLYGETLKEPVALIKKDGARIMGLDDPSKKMSKSAPSPANYISLLDDPEITYKKIMRAVTDSGSEIKSGPDKPAITNLLTIYSLLAERSIKELEKEYQNKQYSDFKKGLAETVVDFIKKFQNKFKSIDDKRVKDIIKQGKTKAGKIASAKMNLVKEKIGIKI